MDEGMKTFSSALSTGALPMLKQLGVLANPGNTESVKVECRRRGIEAPFI